MFYYQILKIFIVWNFPNNDVSRDKGYKKEVNHECRRKRSHITKSEENYVTNQNYIKVYIYICFLLFLKKATPDTLPFHILRFDKFNLFMNPLTSSKSLTLVLKY